MMKFNIEIDREADGRWIAEIPEVPGCMVYGQSRKEAVAKVEALVFRALEDRIQHEQ